MRLLIRIKHIGNHTHYVKLASASSSMVVYSQVTDPPAVENPPSTRDASTMFQLLLAPARGCHTLMKNKLNCMMIHLPNSSDQGAQSSQPNAYVMRNAAMPSRARVIP